MYKYGLKSKHYFQNIIVSLVSRVGVVVVAACWLVLVDAGGCSLVLG